MTLKTKTLTPEAYSALEDIVGVDNISQEPALLDGYCYGMGNEIFYGSRFATRPLAAILPGSTEEVQAIVKICNKYGIKYKAHSTGFAYYALGVKVPLLAVDLRRMNRIIKIDEKNMYAVVEPYVSMGSLFMAAIKKRVRNYVIGAGPSPSALASCTSVLGEATNNVSAGFGGRVPLGVEWVLPNGEILRLGALGTAGEWFNGDGPGMSLKGIMRGLHGAGGGLGIFTKVAIKLVPWYGPSKITSTGKPPSYRVEVPDCFRVYMLTFPSREAYYEAMRLVVEEGIAYWCSRRGPFTQAAAAAGTNKEVAEEWNSGEFQKRLDKFTNNLTIGLDASSPRELEFKDKCLRKIMEKLGGEELREDEDSVSARFVHGTFGLGAVKGTFRSTGAFVSYPLVYDDYDAMLQIQEKAVEIKNKYDKTGAILPDGDSSWVTPLEDWGGHMETVSRIDHTNPEAVKAIMDFGETLINDLAERNPGLLLWSGIPIALGSGDEERGERCMNYHIWMKNIKKALDPDVLSESEGYVHW